MFRATEKVNRAIIALNGNPYWEDIKEWLHTSYGEEAHNHIKDMSSSDSKYRLNQGMVFRLFELIQIIKSARENLIQK